MILLIGIFYQEEYVLQIPIGCLCSTIGTPLSLPQYGVRPHPSPTGHWANTSHA